MKKIIALLLSILMFTAVSCGDNSLTEDTHEDNSQTDSDVNFGYDFGDYGWGYEFSEYEEETEPEPEYDYLIDIFEDVEDWLTFSGAGNECSVKLEIPEDYSQEINGLYIKRSRYYSNVVQLIYNNKEMGTFSFYIDNGYNLKAGDVVTIYDSDIRELNNNLLQNGLYIKDAEYKFDYPDRGSYLTSWEEAVEVFNVLGDKAKEYYCERENIDINSKRAKNVEACVFHVVYGEIKPDEVLNSEKHRVVVGVPIEEYKNGYYYYDIVYLAGIVIESEEKPDGEFYSADDVRVEWYNVWDLNVRDYSRLVDAAFAAATKEYDEYDWHQ